jgi:hypothetical protein
VVAVSALFAVPARYTVDGSHNLRDFTPFFDTLIFIDIFKNPVFLSEKSTYILFPYSSFSHLLLLLEF